LGLVDVLTDEQRKRRDLWIWGLTFAMIATRFESPFLLVAIMVGLSVSRDGAALRKLAISAAASFGLVELWRHYVFGFWMPNTVYAKMQPPYAPDPRWIPMLQARVNATTEIIEVFGGPLLAILLIWAVVLLWKHLHLPQVFAPQRLPVSIFLLGALLFVCWRGWLFFATDTLAYAVRLIPVGLELLAIALLLTACLRREANRLEILTAAMVAAGTAFGILFGKNWGYFGRMILPCLPFFALAIVHSVSRHIPSKYWSRTALVGCLLCQFISWVPVARTAWMNGHRTTSYSAVEKYGRAGDAVRQLAGLDSMSFLLADVGGSALCCEKLQILDSALLANSYLAHRGYKSFEEYLQRERPQSINTHSPWSDLSGIYKSGLLSDYSLVVVDTTRLLVRNDVYSRLYSRLQATSGVTTLYEWQCLMGPEVPKEYPEADIEFVASRHSCLYLSGDDLIQKGISTK
jgi:hypothetical protein